MGYGQFRFRGTMKSSHRVAWILYRGEIPEDKQINHLCHIRSCVNPRHLYLGTQTQNNLDTVRSGRNAQKNKTHCLKGHEFNEENTYTYTKNGRRGCKTCHREWNRNYRRRLRLKEKSGEQRKTEWYYKRKVELSQTQK